ncbi:hypothetical protein B14911_00960 [Bacillus sp. NRRL B-14911]|nr:hypothetical protein B14911_00960 [Bacillus sp. NRRL B-14911]
MNSPVFQPCGRFWHKAVPLRSKKSYSDLSKKMPEARGRMSNPAGFLLK